MNKYLRSPFNYTGSKYELLPQLLPLFPENIGTFVDLFSGGLSVGINVYSELLVVNDSLTEVIDFFKALDNDSFDKVMQIINDYRLSKGSKDAYYKLRDDYNKDGDIFKFYVLTCHSFCNQIRFSKRKHEFNLPFGQRTFNLNMQSNFKEFVDELIKKDVQFLNNDFRKLDFCLLNNNDFAYIDPAYRIATATYNENGAWTEKDDEDLFNLLYKLDKQDVKWGLSNVTHHKGLVNKELIEFSKDYTVHELNKSYSSCNYQIKKENRKAETREVFITNY